MELNRGQKRIKRKLYRSAKGSPEQTAALDVIFKTTETMTDRDAAELVAQAFRDLEAEDIFYSHPEEKLLPPELLEKTKIFKCPICQKLVLGLKDSKIKCSKCGVELVDSGLPLGGLRMSE